MAELRWDCQESGCYLIKLHAPIHLFDDCFGGRIEMSDVDGVVERHRKFLFLEWKVPPHGNLTQGQSILFQQLTAGRGQDVVVWVVWGPVNPEPDTVLDTYTFSNGTQSQRRPLTLEQLRERFRDWYDWANRQP